MPSEHAATLEKIPVADGKLSAKEAHLRYVSDRAAGFSRRKQGDRITYFDQHGRRLTDAAEISRIRALAIPPAWDGVWICPHAHGHVQATGRDARGRKQYRYHPEWRRVRDHAKYDHLLAFAHALPKIRRRVANDLRRRGLGRDKVLAAMVRLLETTLIRVGNEQYLKQNHSVGLSTLRDRHVRVSKGTVHFSFRGKSGKEHEIDLDDPGLARIVRRLREIPGQELFQYIDENGTSQKISSTDINAYLHEIAGAEFSAKDFRTWAATVHAARALAATPAFRTDREARHNVAAAIRSVAEQLRNTPAICRKSYVHPAVVEGYLARRILKLVTNNTESAKPAPRFGLSAEERALCTFLRAAARSAQR
ncbi:MAG: DNA topoisomerase IB [Nibricoccus sp.]